MPQIRSVRPLVDKHASVLDVYLDNNAVESIDDLEGSLWLTNFRVLSLRANKLQQVCKRVCNLSLSEIF